MNTADVRRKHGVSEATFYNCDAKPGSLTLSDALSLKALEENT